MSLIAFQKILVCSEVHQFLEDGRIETLVLLNRKTKKSVLLLSNAFGFKPEAAVRGGRKNKDREEMSDNLPLQGHIILTWE
ncbi:hypothetical protein TNCT_296391, partial [Trichonephila clavata]